MTTPTVDALKRAARAIRAAAQSHKRAEAWHRSRSREQQAALVELREVCAALGIELRIDEAEAESTHGQDERQERRTG